MMLDALFKIKDEQDQTLSFRRSCRYALSESYYREHHVVILMNWIVNGQGGHLWLMCDEHRRQEWPCMSL